MQSRKQSINEACYIIECMILAHRLSPQEKITERPRRKSIKTDMTGLCGIVDLCMDYTPHEVIKIARFLKTVSHHDILDNKGSEQLIGVESRRLKVDFITLKRLIRWIRQ